MTLCIEAVALHGMLPEFVQCLINFCPVPVIGRPLLVWSRVGPLLFCKCILKPFLNLLKSCLFKHKVK